MDMLYCTIVYMEFVFVYILWQLKYIMYCMLYTFWQ